MFQAAFLGERGLTECEFTTRVLDCMFFTGFVQDRGAPWRVCDLWDELYSSLGEQLRQEALDPRLVLSHIQVGDARADEQACQCIASMVAPSSTN